MGIVDVAGLDGAEAQLEARYKAEHRGAALVEILEGALPALDAPERPARIAAMAAAGGIEAGTVAQILAGEINHPPADRLRGFASVLEGVSYDALVAAVIQDGASEDTYRTQARRRVWL